MLADPQQRQLSLSLRIVASTRDAAPDAEAAQLAWDRTLAFVREHTR